MLHTGISVSGAGSPAPRGPSEERSRCGVDGQDRYSRAGLPLWPLLVQAPAQAGKHLVLNPDIGLADGRELEPAVAGEAGEARGELDFRSSREVVQVVSGAESQHARRIEGAAEGRDSPSRPEERKPVARIRAKGDGKDVRLPD